TALRAHATQIPPDSWLNAIASNFGRDLMGVEFYLLAVGERGPGDGPYGWERDLFAGLDTEAGTSAAVASSAAGSGPALGQIAVQPAVVPGPVAGMSAKARPR
ncbi:MAG TPA: hypothetical protein VFX61_19395, partial [Micromonosporaceae bacterium]|nr:hypothetical protein [Micromonosporaceae bacterium]